MSRTTTGLVDLQVNGFAGIDFNAEGDAPPLTAASLDVALEAMLATGVTTCLPTIITAPPPILARRLRALDDAVAASRLGPLMCPGYHLEGPFLNPADGFAGCHPPAAMGPPRFDLVKDWEAPLRRPILLLTLAPELPGALACIQAARAAGKLVAIGHSAGTSEVVGAAAEAGATLSAHLGNGLPATMAKLDNPIFAQLAEDRLHASFIADGIHVPPFALRAMMRAKGPGRRFLVTDATAAAAAQPGRYPFAGMTVERSADGTVRVPGGRVLAGSSLCLDQAVCNVVGWGIMGEAEALDSASVVPAGLLAPALAAHRIERPDNTVEWTPDLRPIRVRIGAEHRVFDRERTTFHA